MADGAAQPKVILREKGLSLSYQNCQTEFSIVPYESIKETELFIRGDHWQGGKGWIGWQPESTTNSAVKTMLFIRNAFTAKNVIGGIVKRLVKSQIRLIELIELLITGLFALVRDDRTKLGDQRPIC